MSASWSFPVGIVWASALARAACRANRTSKETARLVWCFCMTGSLIAEAAGKTGAIRVPEGEVTQQDISI